MSERDIEDTRLTAWETEKESFTCDLCDNDHDLTGLEVLVNDNILCDTCTEYIAADFNYRKRNAPSSFGCACSGECTCGTYDYLLKNGVFPDNKVYEKAIKKWGAITQMQMMMTECGELIAALGRFSVQGRENRKEVEGELADVEIMLDQHRLLFDWEEAKREKLKRLAGIIDGSVDHPHT